MNSKPFRNQNFSLFVFGQTTSTLGTGFLNVSLALYVLKLTGSAGNFSSVLALAMIPNIILGPIAGTIVKKIDFKKMVISMDFIRGVFALILFLFSLLYKLNIWVIYLIVFFYSICQTFFEPAFIKILPGILSKEELVEGNSIQHTINEIALVISPFLGSLIFSLYGIRIILLFDGITYLVSALSEVFMMIPKLQNDTKQSSFIKDIIDDFNVLFIDVRITSLISNGTLTHIFLFPFVLVGFPYIIITLMGGNDVDYGLVQSIATLGSILAIFFVNYAKKKYNISQCIGIGILGMLIFVFLILPLSTNTFFSFLQSNSICIKIFFSPIIFILYLAFGFYGIFYVSFYQATLPHNYLSSYLSLQILFFSLGRILGFKFYGYLFDNYSLLIPISVLGIGMLLKIIVHIPFMKETKRLEKLNNI